MIAPQTVPAETLAALAALVEARSGLRFVGGRFDELTTKLAWAFTESACTSWPDYLAQVTRSSAAFDELVETLTVGETYFYRHRPYFDMLEQQILPEIIARRRDSKRLRLWCAGCATGEEAYSLAIAVRGVLPDLHDWQVSLVATDINRGFLARADAGLYGEWSFRETDPAFRTANFVKEGSRFRVHADIRKLVRFGQLNLAEDDYPSAARGTGALDLILCRNVLLYFGQPLTQQVVDRFHAALAPGGWLVLGPSDPRPGLLASFEMRAADGAVVYRRVERDAPAAAPLPAIETRFLPEPAKDPFAAWSETVSRPPAPPPVTPEGGDWHAAFVAARASADGGALDLAEQQCQQAIARAHLRPEPYYLYGALRLARGDDAGSLEAHRKALYVDPRFVPALVAQAAIHRRAGATARARQELIRAQRLLEGRVADEWVLPDDGLTVGRLRDAVLQALGDAEGGS